MSSNFIKLLTHMISYKNNNFEQALIETYLKFDELLRTDKINIFLKKHSKRRAQNRDADFNIGIIMNNNLQKCDIKKNINYKIEEERFNDFPIKKEKSYSFLFYKFEESKEDLEIYERKSKSFKLAKNSLSCKIIKKINIYIDSNYFLIIE